MATDNLPKESPASDKDTSSSVLAAASKASESSKASTPASSAYKASSSKAKPKPSLLTPILVLLNLILIGVIAAGGYFGWKQWQSMQQTQTSQAQLQADKLANISNANQALKTELAAQQRQVENLLQQQQASGSDIQAKIDANHNQITQLAGRRPADWLLAEADFLVTMAGRKMWLEHDVRTAMLMLQNADSRLADLVDPSLIPLRAKLATDIQTLQNLNPVSVTSVALAIGAMVPQVDNLPLATLKLPDLVDAKQDDTLSADVSDWQANLAKVWHAIVDDFISINKRSEPVQPLMSAQQQWLAREQLKFALLNAQQAALKEQPELYSQNLQTALSTLIAHYDLEKPGVTTFSKSLQQLVDTDIVRKYPERLVSLQAIRDALEQRVAQPFVNQSASEAQP